MLHQLSHSLNLSITLTPLSHFDAEVKKIADQSRKFGAKMTEAKRKSSAIIGTSVKPYELLRDNLYYLNELFSLNTQSTPGMEFYLSLPQHDKLRILRYIDPEQFKNDLLKHNMTEWRHPEDTQ